MKSFANCTGFWKTFTTALSGQTIHLQMDYNFKPNVWITEWEMVVIRVVFIRLLSFKILHKANNPDQNFDETVFIW